MADARKAAMLLAALTALGVDLPACLPKPKARAPKLPCRDGEPTEPERQGGVDLSRGQPLPAAVEPGATDSRSVPGVLRAGSSRAAVPSRTAGVLAGANGAALAQPVERGLGKGEVASSSLVGGPAPRGKPPATAGDEPIGGDPCADPGGDGAAGKAATASHTEHTDGSDGHADGDAAAESPGPRVVSQEPPSEPVACSRADSPPSAAVKRCVQCREVKGLEEFYRVHKDGEARQSRCRLCDNNMRLARGEGSREHAGRSHKGDTCGTCHSMPSRVTGDRCADYGLEPEQPPRAVDFTTGGESALGRAMSE